MKKEDWQTVYGQPSAAFDTRFRQTLDRLEEKEEKQMKRISVRAVLIAVALILALTGAAYAASQGWMIGDYFGRRGPGQAPDGFESGFSGDYTQEIGPVRFHIRDAYLSGDTLTALVEVTRTDGQPCLFLTESVSEEEDGIAYFDQTLSAQPEDQRTIAQYAKDEGLNLCHVGSWFAQDGEMKEGAGDEWAEDDNRMLVMMCQITDIHAENGKARVSWDVYTGTWESGLQEKSLEIELPVEACEEWTVQVNRPVDGLPVVVDSLTLRQSRLEMEVDLAYHLDKEKMPENIPEQSPAALDYRIIHLCDPETGERLPMGARITGGMRWLNEEHTAFDGALGSISGVYSGDTLRLNFYDPWQDIYIGSIDVKIR